MAKIALIVLALVAVSQAKPFGGIGVAHKTHHVSSSIISPYMGLGLGYGMLGHHGIGIGHSVSTHVSHAVPHFGLGHMGMMKGLYGMYPGGIGMGYGIGMMG